MRSTHLQWVHGTGIIASREVVTRRLLAEIQYQVAVLPTAGRHACLTMPGVLSR